LTVKACRWLAAANYSIGISDEKIIRKAAQIAVDEI